MFVIRIQTHSYESSCDRMQHLRKNVQTLKALERTHNRTAFQNVNQNRMPQVQLYVAEIF